MDSLIEETRDAFLGGKIHAYQPKNGFRAGTDTIFLAAAVPAKSGDQVLELGAGSGVGLLALGARIPNLKLFGAELVPANSERANRNLAEAGLKGQVSSADIFQTDADFLKQQYDHVFMNPPFFDEKSHHAPQDINRAHAHILVKNINDWMRIGLKRVRPKGTLTVIYPASGLQNIINSIPEHHSIEILAIQNKIESPPKRVLVHIRNQSQNPLILHAPLILQNENGERTDIGNSIARKGTGIMWGK